MRIGGVEIPDTEVKAYSDDAFRRSLEHFLSLTGVDEDLAVMLLESARRSIGEAHRRTLDDFGRLLPEDIDPEYRAGLGHLVATAFLSSYKPLVDDAERDAGCDEIEPPPVKAGSRANGGRSPWSA